MNDNYPFTLNYIGTFFSDKNLISCVLYATFKLESRIRENNIYLFRFGKPTATKKE